MLPERFQDTFERLVAFPSVSRDGNRDIAEWVADRLESCGFQVELDVAPPEEGKPDRANVIARSGPAECPPGRGLVLCGHLDVVPADEDGWSGDPFGLRDLDDRWVGRGACDMKGFDALAIETAAEEISSDLSAPLVLLFTYDEEVGSFGAQRLAERWQDDRDALPQAVVIGEPTELEVVRMHKGHLRCRLEIRGRAAHSGFPQRGRSAIEAAGRAVVALADLRRRLQAEELPSSVHFPEAPFQTLNIGTIRGGSALNVVPDLCHMDLGIRLLPDSDTDRILGRIREALGVALEEEDWTFEPGHLSPPMHTDEDAPIVDEIRRLADSGPARAASFSSDGGMLDRLGLDVVLWGPGSIEVAHRPDEHLPRAETERAAGILRQLIRSRCR